MDEYLKQYEKATGKAPAFQSKARNRASASRPPPPNGLNSPTDAAVIFNNQAFSSEVGNEEELPPPPPDMLEADFPAADYDDNESQPKPVPDYNYMRPVETELASENRFKAPSPVGRKLISSMVFRPLNIVYFMG